jgi:hypothetical protein
MITHRPTLYVILLPLALAAALSYSTESSNSGAPLSLEEVVKMSRSGISEDVIITRIKKNAKPFDLSAEELAELKKAGISDNVVKFLLDPAQPYAPPSPPPAPSPLSQPPPPGKTYPADDYASSVPPEPGLYHFLEQSPVRTEIKMLLGQKVGKLSMKKGKTIAYLVGPTAKARAKGPAPAFYIRLPEGKGIEELVLVAFERKHDRREIQMQPGPEAMRQFDSLEVGPHLYKITSNKLAAGEYLFFLVGSAEPSKGTYGKGWDFGIENVPGVQAKS